MTIKNGSELRPKISLEGSEALKKIKQNKEHCRYMSGGVFVDSRPDIKTKKLITTAPEMLRCLMKTKELLENRYSEESDLLNEIHEVITKVIGD